MPTCLPFWVRLAAPHVSWCVYDVPGCVPPTRCCKIRNTLIKSTCAVSGKRGRHAPWQTFSVSKIRLRTQRIQQLGHVVLRKAVARESANFVGGKSRVVKVVKASEKFVDRCNLLPGLLRIWSGAGMLPRPVQGHFSRTNRFNQLRDLSVRGRLRQ